MYEHTDPEHAVHDGMDMQEKAAEELPDIQVKNSRTKRVLKLQEEARRRSELELQRGREIRKEQEYVNQISLAIEESMARTGAEQQYHEELEHQIHSEVYRLHGISGDKLQGMTEYRNAWYQGAASAVFFLSVLLFVICGVLHGFGAELCIFMAFYTAIEGAMLSNQKKQPAVFDRFIKLLYLLLFPVMLGVFICYELDMPVYAQMMPVLSIAGVCVLVIGAVSYFIYDPYRMDRRNRRKADRYIRDMEKAAQKEVALKMKALKKQQAKNEKLALKAEKKENRAWRRKQKREKRRAWWAARKPGKKAGGASVSEETAAEKTLERTVERAKAETSETDPEAAATKVEPEDGPKAEYMPEQQVTTETVKEDHI